MATLLIGSVAIVLTLLVGAGLNVALLVGLALSVAASANFPALALALGWRRLTTAGAITGMGAGLVSSLVLISVGPFVMGEAALFPYTFPTLVSIPCGFLGCWVGSVLSGNHTSLSAFDELQVRAHTGLGSEKG